MRNIVYELLESQVDPTIPMPRVEAIHPEDEALARGVEALLRHEVQRLHLTEKNDIQERTAPTQGGLPLRAGRRGRDGPAPQAGDTAAGGV